MISPKKNGPLEKWLTHMPLTHAFTGSNPVRVTMKKMTAVSAVLYYLDEVSMIGQRVLELETIDSTNNYIKRERDHLEDGFLVVSKTQTQGRGRHGNIWDSALKNLYFSFLIKKECVREELFSVLIHASLTVSNVLAKLGMSSTIKYPNDILVNGKKISGILMESIGYQKIDSIIVGVGINLEGVSDDSLKDKATSINEWCEKNVTPNDVLNLFIQEYNQFIPSPILFREYKKKLTFHNNTLILSKKEWKILDVLEDGSLLLECEGRAITLDYNHVSLPREYQ